MKYFLFLLIVITSASCTTKTKELIEKETQNEAILDTKISPYVVKVFIDSQDNMWFGTLEKGVAKYDGKKLIYLTMNDGLASNRVTGIVEDSDGNIWFGTGMGISKYDGENFSNYSESDGLCSNMTSNLLIDSKGTLWIGTWQGVCLYDGKSFAMFSLPYPEVSTRINLDTKDWITELKEDSEGNIWIARDGYGACKYNGDSLSHILITDGLLSNNVSEIQEDKDGNIWFGTRVAEKDDPDPMRREGKGGLNVVIEETMQSFPEIEGFSDGDIGEIFLAKDGLLWISTRHHGVYSYNGTAFTNFDVPISIMSIAEDKEGIKWLGGAGGLYKINKKGEVIYVSQKGPWSS